MTFVGVAIIQLALVIPIFRTWKTTGRHNVRNLFMLGTALSLVFGITYPFMLYWEGQATLLDKSLVFLWWIIGFVVIYVRYSPKIGQ